MKTQELNRCCGVRYLYEFDEHAELSEREWRDGLSSRKTQSPKVVKKAVQDHMETYLGPYKKSGLILTVNDVQDKTLRPVFEELGFQRIDLGQNGNDAPPDSSHPDSYGHSIILYVKSRHGPVTIS